MLRPDTFALTLLLAVMTMLGPLSTDMYLPSLPDMARLLSTDAAHVQLTLSSYLIGFACGQIVYGPVSDRHGRKPVILIALGIYGLSTLVCALTSSIEALIVARFFQAVGGSGAIVLARAIVRDLYSGARAARELALMGVIMAFAPLVAPLMGGVLQTYFGWRASFVLLVGIAVIGLLAVRFLLPETLKHRSPEPVSVIPVLRIYRSLLRNRGFVAYLGILAASFGGMFAWISGSPFVLQNLYGLSPLGFSLTFAGGCTGYLFGTWLATRLVPWIGIDRTIGFGGVALSAGGLLMLASVWLGWRSGVSLAVPTAIYLVGFGLTLPQAMAGALTPFPDRAGAASSLMGFVQQVFAAAVGALVGYLVAASALPMALAIAMAGLLTLAIWFFTRGARRREAMRHEQAE